MRILVDADGCPVVEEVLRIGKQFGLSVLLVCDSSHEMRREGAETLVVCRGADAADFALVNRTERGDLVITQDYGLAAMALARGANALDQNGRRYTPENIDALLAERHLAALSRRAGGRMRGPSRRKPAQDEAFCRELEKLCREGREQSDL